MFVYKDFLVDFEVWCLDIENWNWLRQSQR